MRIGIDIRMFNKYGTSNGIGRYTYNLIKNLLKIDQENEYLLFSNISDKDTPLPVDPRLKIKQINLPMFSLRSQFSLPLVLRREKLDVFHTPYFDAPLAVGLPLVMTIHDLIHLIFPQYFSKKVQFFYQGIVKPAARRSGAIISDSESSKKDIVKILGVPEGRVAMIYPGVEDKCKPLANLEILESLRRKYSFSEKIVLFVGNMKPHKNLIRLIEAFDNLKREKRIDCQLVVVGKEERHFRQAQAKVKELKLQQGVVFTGFVPDEEMHLLYNAAEILVIPSLYEGFGLPALEAMACGTAVIASRTSSLPEVVGEAAILVDPYSVEEMTEAMQRILIDDILKQELERKGLERAKLFSWEKTAQETLKVYRQAGRGNS